MQTLTKIENFGEIVETFGNFYSNLQELRKEGIPLITPRDEAYARLQTRGKENIGKKYGTWTSAGLEYIKGKNPILRLDSRLLDPEMAKKVVEANRENNYFCTETTEEYEKSLKQAEEDKNKDPKDRNVIILPSRNKFTITDKENWEVLEAVLKDQAKLYFEFNGLITAYLVDRDIIDAQDGTLLTQLWLGRLDGHSGFYGYHWYLGDVSSRGIRDEVTAQKIS